MNNFFRKVAGILDPPKGNLAPDVWTANKKLIPQLKKQILSKLHAFVPKNKIKEILIIGSITGWKYKDSSDIDINVAIDPYDDRYQKARLSVNEFLSYRGKHPINFYMVPYKGVSTAWQDAKFGVYDVMADKWVVPPQKRASVRDPKKQFNLELQISKHVASTFDRQVKEFYKDTSKLRYLKENLKDGWQKKWYIRKKEAEVLEGLEEIKDFVKSLDDGRHMVYSKGWGVPRTSFRNILYKSIEHGPYKKFFEEIKSLNKADA